MDLSTKYLDLDLKHPLMPGASPMVDNLDIVKRLEDAGAAAIVMHSLFEEQITQDQASTSHFAEASAGSSAEALSYFPRADEFRLGPEEYLEQVARIKRTVAIPVIASLNGTTARGWVKYAKLIQQAGADAIELNVYYLATDPLETGSAVEGRTIEVLQAIKRSVDVPIAVKLSPFYSALAHFGRELAHAGANGLVLFNRFYQPDIDVDALEVTPSLVLSTSAELRLRLRWLAVLSGTLGVPLAASGGIHTATDAVKAIMCGANAVQLVSALLQNGPEYLQVVLDGLVTWMEDHEYESLRQMQGSMNLARCPDAAAFERANYMKVLQGWRV